MTGLLWDFIFLHILSVVKLTFCQREFATGSGKNMLWHTVELEIK